MAEDGESRQAGHRRAEDERPAVGLDQVLDAAYPEGKSENDERGRGQRDMHAVKLQRALKASARDGREASLRALGR